MFFLALAVRLAHFWFMHEHDPLFGVLLRGGDNHGYHRWGLEIAQTFWLGWDRLPFTQGPLYPYFLGMAFLRFGSSYATAVVVQHVLGGLHVPRAVFTGPARLWLFRGVDCGAFRRILPHLLAV